MVYEVEHLKDLILYSTTSIILNETHTHCELHKTQEDSIYRYLLTNNKNVKTKYAGNINKYATILKDKFNKWVT